MIKNMFVVTSWGLTKNLAMKGANKEAHHRFTKFIKDKGPDTLQSAEMSIVNTKRHLLFKYDFTYDVCAKERPRAVCVVTYKEPTKKKIKKTPKKVYKKRDKKGRFSK